MIFMFLWFGSLPHVPPAAIGIMAGTNFKGQWEKSAPHGH